MVANCSPGRHGDPNILYIFANDEASKIGGKSRVKERNRLSITIVEECNTPSAQLIKHLDG